jgi:D-amino peptidase
MTGSDRPLSIMENVGMAGVAAVFFTGFHAKAGTPAAPLAHTWTGSINDLRFDGVSTGEFGIAAAVAGYYDVPVMMVAGDDKAVAQTQEMLGPQVVGAVVKEGISTFSALHLHPERAQPLIREAAQEAMGRIPGAQPYRLANAVIEVEFDHQARADQAILVPGVVRAGERTVAWVAQDGKAFMQTFLAVTTVAGIATE